MTDFSHANETPPPNVEWGTIDWDKVHNETITELVEILRRHFMAGSGTPPEISYRLVLLGCAADAMRAKYLRGTSDG